ncbi:hypothetical protein JMJ35_009286 [Cladonia borealis]|uniref:Peptidase A1 domain-containing protein n=1 Tax=Cladonia borealis TaxID=184061 RepID=A0AA39QS52_9LECA|nr:hypothetical protein JMJ35_009286 [Cladonia borealis]
MTEVSHLALGGPGNGSVTLAPGFLGQKFPAVLAVNGTIPSNSCGLHYGSASLKTVGFLTWGGYDQSRVLGDVASYNLEDEIQDDMIALLLDIQIGVGKGNSPFNAPSFTNLLQINASYGFNGAQPANINPTLPYMFMAPETCAAIAQHLPISLQAYSGLYIWNTTDPLYNSIIESPAYLAFVFSTSGANNVTIKIPFQLLNLTLDNSIATPPLPYFPCKPFNATDGSIHYFFGKAFLQAAFLGMNWEKSQFFLAQAPGPGAAAPNIQAIASDATTIESDQISNFDASWDQTWTPIGASAANSNRSSNTSTPLNGGSGLSGSAKAGIGVGVTLGVSAIAGLVILLFLRRRRRGKTGTPSLSELPESSRQEGEATTKDHFQYIPPVEKDGKRVEHELDSGDGLPQEMGAGAGPEN